MDMLGEESFCPVQGDDARNPAFLIAVSPTRSSMRPSVLSPLVSILLHSRCPLGGPWSQPQFQGKLASV